MSWPRLLAVAVTVSAAAWSAGADQPRTEPMDPKPKHANRLAKETSPYLLLHAHNPVDWYPWCPEAFEKAKKENKLIFLSIGYSSCYWCHVMERQSFMNEEIAKLLNEKFVCIKVDREERPDVDNIYMTALQVQGARGGWPLSMFLLPDGRPIGGGTYWPPFDKGEGKNKRTGFKTILTELNKGWEDEPKKVTAYAENLTEGVQRALTLAHKKFILVDLNRELVNEVLEAVVEEYDAVNGGFGTQGPKFPQPSAPELLLDLHHRTQDKKLREMLTHTLDRMAQGGIYDHLGGGFHRYTVEKAWKIPHFEKMLYDNAQLASLYSRAFRLTRNPAYRRVVEETLAFVEREMTAPNGGFYSAIDAQTDGEEGKFYLWTAEEIDKLLGEADAELFKRVYGVADGPNFEEKYNVLLLTRPFAELAKEMKLSEDDLLARLKPIRAKLLEARGKRPRPLLDTKILTGWNGLMIAGFADAAVVFDQPRYAAAAEKAADFIVKNLKSQDGRLLRTYSSLPGGKGEAKLNAYLEDYAYLIQGLLALHDATRKKRWLQEAADLTNLVIQHHHDKENGGYFFTSHDHEKLFARAKDQFDGAVPSGNSIMALNLVKLAKKTGNAKYSALAEESFRAFSGSLKNHPTGMAAMARALAQWLDTEKPSIEPGKLPPKEDDPSPARVSATITPAKPGKDGQQVITVVLDIDKNWHAYANPPGDDALFATKVTVHAKVPPASVRVEYPKGEEKRDEDLKKSVFLYEGKVEIKVVVARGMIEGKFDDSPLEITVQFQVCDETRCYPPAKKRLVPEAK